jgi:hypothetical protein
MYICVFCKIHNAVTKVKCDDKLGQHKVLKKARWTAIAGHVLENLCVVAPRGDDVQYQHWRRYPRFRVWCDCLQEMQILRIN